MNPSHSLSATPASMGYLARGWVLGAVLVLVFASPCFTTAADEDPAPITPAQYEGHVRLLVDGKRSKRKGVLNRMVKQPRAMHGKVYGGIFGAIFDKAELTAHLAPEARRELFAQLITHLAEEQPANSDGGLLLVSQFLPHLAADVTLRKELRSGDWLVEDTDGRFRGWDKIMQSVLGVLDDARPSVRSAAIQLAADSVATGPERVDVPRIVAFLYGAMNDTGWSKSEHAALLDAFDVLLRNRFRDIEALKAFLAPYAERLAKVDEWQRVEQEAVRAELFDAVLLLRRAGESEVGARHRAAAIRTGEALIAAAKGPGELTRFFDPSESSYVELQQAAMRKAADLKPEANKAWADLIVKCLDHCSDPQSLELVTNMIGETFTEFSTETDVAEAVARRLETGLTTDSVQSRVDLARILSPIGKLTLVLKPLPESLENGSTKQAPVYAQLIRAIGLVHDGLVSALRPRLESGGRRQPDWARKAVAEALGFRGIRENEAENPKAVLLLRHILTGIEVDLGGVVVPASAAETVESVRVAAIDSLQFYPGPEAAVVLEGVAGKNEEPMGGAARRALGRQLKRASPDAASAFARLVEHTRGDPLLIELLDIVARDTPDGLAGPSRVALARAVRDLLAIEGRTDALAAKAAEVLARLRDVEAVALLFRLWKPAADNDAVVDAWRKPVEDLVVAVAKTPGAEDPLDIRLVDALRATFQKEGRHGDALAAYAAMGDAANRFELKVGRAALHSEIAVVPDVDRDAPTRRADLDDAARLYEELLAQASPSRARELHAALYKVLFRRAQNGMIDKDKKEQAQPFLFRAVDAAIHSVDKTTAEAALQEAVPQLERAPLDDQEKQRLTLQKTKLQELIG